MVGNVNTYISFPILRRRCLTHQRTALLETNFLTTGTIWVALGVSIGKIGHFMLGESKRLAQELRQRRLCIGILGNGVRSKGVCWEFHSSLITSNLACSERDS
jgi:hypothetical protein